MRSTLTATLALALALAPTSALLPPEKCVGDSNGLGTTDCTVWQQFYGMNSPPGSEEAGGDVGWNNFCNSLSGTLGRRRQRVPQCSKP